MGAGGGLKRFWQGIRARLLGAPDPARERELLAQHRDRCLNFRLLLGANNRALESMAAMEEALDGGRPFGMEFVRGTCTRVSSDVYRMIKALDALAPKKYFELYDRHALISELVASSIRSSLERGPGPNVLPFEAIGVGDLDETGAKAGNVALLRGLDGVRVPEGFVVTASGFRSFMAHRGLAEEIERRIQAQGGGGLDRLYALCSSIQQLVVSWPLPEDLESDILVATTSLARPDAPLRLAVRSSAVGEDAAGLSFAGQFRSELNVHPDSVIDAYRDVISSFYGATAVAYRMSHGLRAEDNPMCVAVMPMVRCAAGGVVYTANPMRPGDDAVLVSAVHGLPKLVVDGADGGQTWRVERGEDGELAIAGRDGSDQEIIYIAGEDEGLDRQELSADQRAGPVLDDLAVLRLARLALDIEARFGAPQDIEWGLDPDQGFVILQARELALEAIPERRTGPTQNEVILLRCGVTGSPGVGGGPVHIIRNQADALEFPDGAVLVAAQALPQWAALLPRAAALICERGGVVGHLATVAREYGVPALFQCKSAVSALKEAAVVTVDADAMIVVPGLRQFARPRKSGLNFLGSPVHAALSRAAGYVVPLNLLDPSSEDFAPAFCRTFHDITRFCHEMSVREMFAPENAPPLPLAGAKRLVGEVRTQYWVIDLGGGFAAPVAESTVSLELIANKALPALLEGSAMRPWEGPPPVDMRGFMSVLNQAASNPELEAGARSAMAERNYFMISDTFLSLQCRFGFHFCTLEVEAGPDRAANYVSFRFTGGGADQERRRLRAAMVGDLLEERGFRVELTADTLCAHLENLAESEVRTLMRVLGYLITHTRQLDMVMADRAEAARRTERIRSDLARLAAEPGAIAETDDETAGATA